MPKYIHFTEEQKQAAKSVDLAQFLQSRGEQIKKSGSEYEWIDHHITLRGNQFYDQYQQKGGTAVDFVREYYDLSYPEAVLLLIDNEELRMNNVCTLNALAKQKSSIEVKNLVHYPLSNINSPLERRKPFTLPPANENMRRVYAYLIKQRYIDRDIIYHFAHRGLLYEDAKYHNAVFVGTDKNGHPQHAHKKSTSINDSSYRGNQAGSKAAFSFHHVGRSDTVYVFEAPIDMLSFITMYPNRWQGNSYVTLCSVADKALFHQLEENPQLCNIKLCLDNDDAGRTAMERIKGKLHEKGYADVEILLCPLKDWNEMLKQLTSDNGQLTVKSNNNCQLSTLHCQLNEPEETSCQGLQLY